LRLIESRIDGIENTEPPEAFDLRIKTLQPTPWISHRFTCAEPAHAFHIVAEIAKIAAKAAEPAPSPHQLAVGYGDFTDTDVDLEAGIIVRELPATTGLTLADGSPLRASTLPRVDAVTGIRLGLPQLSSAFYAGLGRWLTANDAEISGPVRELFIQVPDPNKGREPIVEVQFPIRPRTQRVESEPAQGADVGGISSTVDRARSTVGGGEGF